MAKNLEAVFTPRSIAIIGAAREPNKIGNVIVKNFLDGAYPGKVYPVNPNADTILGLKCYKSVLDIQGHVDQAVISIPAKFVPAVMEECGKKGVKAAVVITGGFSEVGSGDLEKQVADIARKYNIAMIGPNCLGVLNPAARVDSMFIPVYKLGRPRVGDISFISQSGAVGSCIIDLAAHAGVGIGKFVSYGNATVIDIVDLLEYLEKDKGTRIIVVYVEGIRRGKEFVKLAKRIAHKKPIIVLKAGITARGAAAAKSHTGSLAGSAAAYHAAFQQARLIEASSLDELFTFAKIFQQPYPSGKRVAVVTNGGGNGVLCADAIEMNNLELAEFSDETKEKLKQFLPTYTNVGNPLDLIGDADAARYGSALAVLMDDPNVDSIVVVTLFQTISLDANVTNVIVRESDKKTKPICVVATGGDYTQLLRRILDSYGVPTYNSPLAAVRALANFTKYAEHFEKVCFLPIKKK